VFKQETERKIHPSMSPHGLATREACDSAEHPYVTPLALGLDVTGSMLDLPKELIMTGLPHIMSKLIERGIDPSLLFAPIGDHHYDRSPLQVGQFEASDEAIDMWLTRTWLEAGGGGNEGESYLLFWYLLVYHTHIDSFEKRKKKGFAISVGDEPNLRSISGSAIKEIFGKNAGEKDVYTADDLYKEACKKWHVYHINILHSSKARGAQGAWKELLGDRLLNTDGSAGVPDLIIDTVVKYKSPHENDTTPAQKAAASAPVSGTKDDTEEYML
jgi:hypothetical protein